MPATGRLSSKLTLGYRLPVQRFLYCRHDPAQIQCVQEGRAATGFGLGHGDSIEIVGRADGNQVLTSMTACLSRASMQARLIRRVLPRVRGCRPDDSPPPGLPVDATA